MIDNNLASAQLAIGEASNLAQLALTYSYNFEDKKYVDYVCIMSVLAQIAIDNAKRRFDVDLQSEIKRIKKDMDIKENLFPSFWAIIKKDFNIKRINHGLSCPMNYLCSLKLQKFRSKQSTIKTTDFLNEVPIILNKKKNKKVEDFISKYSFDLSNSNYAKEEDDFILMWGNFDELIENIREIYVSNNYKELMAWLINRAFSESINTNTSKNKAVLLKTLYEISPKVFLSCFKCGGKT